MIYLLAYWICLGIERYHPKTMASLVKQRPVWLIIRFSQGRRVTMDQPLETLS
jgi:hypothetical protein